MALQDIVRFILPKEDHFYDFLEQQALLAHEGAQALSALANGGSVAEVKAAVKEVEQRGDKVSHQVEDALGRTFVTPIDREDIHKLSSMLDDILDRAYGTASAFDMFSIAEPTDAMRRSIELLVRTTAKLSDMLPLLRKHDWDGIRTVTRELKVLEKEGDEIYRGEMRRLFSLPEVDARALIREKEVIEILEDAVDTCEDVAEYLSNLAVKNG